MHQTAQFRAIDFIATCYKCRSQRYFFVLPFATTCDVNEKSNYYLCTLNLELLGGNDGLCSQHTHTHARTHCWVRLPNVQIERNTNECFYMNLKLSMLFCTKTQLTEHNHHRTIPEDMLHEHRLDCQQIRSGFIFVYWLQFLQIANLNSNSMKTPNIIQQCDLIKLHALCILIFCVCFNRMLRN